MIGRLLFRHPLPPLLLIWLCIALLEVGGAWDHLNRYLLDFSLRRIAKVEEAPADAALVLIDERTIQGVAKERGLRWPWPRDTFAYLAAGLHQAGARQVVFDLAFVEPSEDTLKDDLLGSVTAACPGLVLASLKAQGEIPERRPAIWPAELVQAHPELARRIGHVQPVIDRDGVLRRYAFADSLAARALPSGVTEPSGATQVLRWYGGTRELAGRGSVMSALEFIRDGRRILEDVTDEVILDPKQLAAKWSELPRSNSEGQIRGKTVFVGANAAAAYDRVATPVGRVEAGALAHYTAWANATRGESIREAPRIFGASLDILLAPVLAAALLLFGWQRRQLGFTWVIGILAGVGLLGGAFLLLRAGWWIPPGASAGGLAMGLLMSASHNWWTEAQRKQEIQSLFGNYVSDHVVRELLENPDAIRFGGERKKVTVYFSDLAGFTAFSERVEPEVLVDLMNRYLADMSEILIEEGGYLDKYIGDAIMGVFGAPEVLPNHALSACRTALRSQRRLADLSRKFEEEYGVPVTARIGINTGEAVVGNFGFAKKRNYTVVGDNVNFASRLEAANKEFGSGILIGPETAEMVRGEMVIRPVARLRVPGKLRPQETFELLGEGGEGNEEEQEFLRHYLAGYDAFFRREFAVAENHFRVASAMKPADKVAAHYLEEAAKWVLSAPPTDWEGIYIVKSK